LIGLESTKLPEQETLMVPPTTRPRRARALAVIAAVLAALALMHLAVAAVLIPGLAATAPSLARPAPPREQ
jgi:hypothetical protein